MAASANDKFKKSGASTVTSLAAPGKALGATSITVGSTTNYPTDTGIIIAIRVVDTSGNLVAGTYTEWSATVTSATSLAIVGTPVYGSDQVYSAGSTTQVYMPVSSVEHNTMIDGLLVSHDQDGTLKAGAVDVAAVLADDVVETAKIKNKAATLPKINGGATAGVIKTDSSGTVTSGSIVYRRQGGNATTWGTPGTTNYDTDATGDVKMQVGVISLSAGANAVTFPVSFTGTPVIVVTPSSAAATYPSFYIVSMANTGFTIQVNQGSGTFTAQWIAIGV